MLLFWNLVLRGHFIPLFKQENVELNGCFPDVHLAEPRLRKHLLKLLLGISTFEQHQFESDLRVPRWLPCPPARDPYVLWVMSMFPFGFLSHRSA
jgi:hypothetical protein